MISIPEALRMCLQSVRSMSAESVPTEEALHRILNEDVYAHTALPPWDNSAMDGYAVVANDTDGLPTSNDSDACGPTAVHASESVRLHITETIAAGAVAKQPVSPGHAARIMTGAPMPAGADAVIMREHTTESDTHVLVHRRVLPGQNVRKAGENVPANTRVLQAGTALTPAALGLCAAVGRSSVMVSRQPRVAILSTGNEVVPPGKPLQKGQIHSSNAHALYGWVREAGGCPVNVGIAPDNLIDTRNALATAVDADLLISTGGVSVGDYDVVRQAMNDMGAEMQFWKVRMKPGKPLAFGMIQGTPAFGLPGNPVSCQVGFLQFVRPWIRKAQGVLNPFLPVIKARFENAYRKKAGRAELVRVEVRLDASGPIAALAGSQGSGNQMSMVHANGLLLMSELETILQPGDHVDVQLFGPLVQPGHTPALPW